MKGKAADSAESSHSLVTPRHRGRHPVEQDDVDRESTSTLTDLEDTPRGPPAKKTKVDPGIELRQAVAARRMVAAEISVTQGAKLDLLSRDASSAPSGGSVTPVTR